MSYPKSRMTDANAELKERVRHCFEAGALATGCELTMDWHEDVEYQPLKSNRPMVAGSSPR